MRQECGLSKDHGLVSRLDPLSDNRSFDLAAPLPYRTDFSSTFLHFPEARRDEPKLVSCNPGIFAAKILLYI